MNLLSSSMAFMSHKPEKDIRFSERYTFEQRCTQSAKIRLQYPDHVLLIVEAAPTTNGANKTNVEIVNQNIKTKYIVPNEHTVGRFLASFRKNVVLSENQAIYLLTLVNTTPALNMTMSQLDQKYRSEDGFLYLIYTAENTFGKEEKVEKEGQ